MSVAHADSTTAQADKRSLDAEFDAVDVDPSPETSEDGLNAACDVSSHDICTVCHT